MKMKRNVSKGYFVGQKVSLMLDRAPAWPHLGLGDAKISAVSDNHIRIDGVLNDFGLDGTFLYEIVESNPGAASIRLKIDSNRFTIDCTKEASCIEMGAKKLLFFDSGEFKRLAALDYHDEGLAPSGIEVFADRSIYEDDNYRIHFDYA